MTSHFDRYHNIKPKAFASVAEYDRFFQHVNKCSQKEKLLFDAKQAVSWGNPSSESIGYTSSEFTSIIRRLVQYIESMD